MMASLHKKTERARKKRLLAALLLMLMLLLASCAPEQAPFAEIPNPIATIEMSDGESMRFELFVQEAPNTVANFVELANAGFYDGQRIFYIVPGVMIRAGDPKMDGSGSARHRIQGEFSKNGIENRLSHTRGTISMSRTEDYDSASSQFFILQGSYPEYDGSYAAFGRATDAQSLKLIDRLASTPVDRNYQPQGPQPTIARIRVDTQGYTYEAAKLEAPKKATSPDRTKP